MKSLLLHRRTVRCNVLQKEAMLLAIVDHPSQKCQHGCFNIVTSPRPVQGRRTKQEAQSGRTSKMLYGIENQIPCRICMSQQIYICITHVSRAGGGNPCTSRYPSLHRAVQLLNHVQLLNSPSPGSGIWVAPLHSQKLEHLKTPSRQCPGLRQRTQQKAVLLHDSVSCAQRHFAALRHHARDGRVRDATTDCEQDARILRVHSIARLFKA